VLKTFFRTFISTRMGLGVALAGFIGISALAQNSGTTGQIVPGATGSISPSGGVNPKGSNPPAHVMANALSPQTRQTLQEAMNTVNTASTPMLTDMIVGPGEAVEMDGATIDQISFNSLPDVMKTALNFQIYAVLRNGAGR
jgi:hypothetical protein